jgi:hypothetical protein
VSEYRVKAQDADVMAGKTAVVLENSDVVDTLRVELPLFLLPSFCVMRRFRSGAGLPSQPRLPSD